LVDGLPEITMILSDLQLEGEETGVDFVASLGETKPLTIFMTSLPASHELVQMAQRIGPVLSKPFDVAELQRILQNGG
jgi:CheY-like chemotaxis protein